MGWQTPTTGWPTWLWSLRFDGSRRPSAEEPAPTEAGKPPALRLRGRRLVQHRIDNLRPSQLWADTPTASRERAGNLTPLDLVLFNASTEPCGAHTGLVMATDQVFHPSREVGHSAV